MKFSESLSVRRKTSNIVISILCLLTKTQSLIFFFDKRKKRERNSDYVITFIMSQKKNNSASERKNFDSLFSCHKFTKINRGDEMRCACCGMLSMKVCLTLKHSPREWINRDVFMFLFSPFSISVLEMDFFSLDIST
jgi:hypothetical protein